MKALALKPWFCVVDLVDITPNEKDGGYIWHLANKRVIIPFPVKCRLRLFNIDEEIRYPQDADPDNPFTEEEIVNWWLDGGICELDEDEVEDEE